MTGYPIDLAPLAIPQYSCTTCLVGWSSIIGDRCWYCGEKADVNEPINLWWMKQYSQPVWRARSDTHTTGAGT